MFQGSEGPGLIAFASFLFSLIFLTILPFLIVYCFSLKVSFLHCLLNLLFLIRCRERPRCSQNHALLKPGCYNMIELFLTKLRDALQGRRVAIFLLVSYKFLAYFFLKFCSKSLKSLLQVLKKLLTNIL